jgi:hypothetical protein
LTLIKQNLFNQRPLKLGRESWDSHGAGQAMFEHNRADAFARLPVSGPLIMRPG